MESIFIFPGLVFEAVIRWIATLLAAEGTAGNICIMLLVVLIIVSTRFISIQNNASSLVSKALEIIYRSEGEKDFSANLELRRDLQNFDQENKGEFAHNFATAWREYNETFYEDDHFLCIHRYRRILSEEDKESDYNSIISAVSYKEGKIITQESVRENIETDPSEGQDWSWEDYE